MYTQHKNGVSVFGVAPLGLVAVQDTYESRGRGMQLI